MAITVPSKSAQYTDATATPPAAVKAYDWGAKLRASHASLTFTTAGFTTASAGDIKLIRMPAGKVRILTDLCRIVCPVGTATSDLDIGYGAYVNAAGTPVNADGDALGASIDVGGGAIDAALDLPANGILEIESQSGFDIVCSFDTADSPASGALKLTIVYMIGN
jgi:hypothetical protein